MFEKLYINLKEHIYKHIGVYLTVCAAIIIGICTGAFTINGMSSSQTNELSDYLGGYLRILEDQNINSGELFLISLKNNLVIFILTFISGMTIIGIPFAYFFAALNAYLTGFSVGLLVKILGYKGILYALVSILPSELFLLPAMILMTVNAVIFSKNITKQLLGKNLTRSNFKENLISYLLLTGLCFLIMLIGILLEGYLSPLIIKLMISVFI